MASKLTLEDYQAASLGLKGIRVLTGASTAGEHFVGFKVVTDTTIGWTPNNPNGDTSAISGKAFTAGDTVVIGDGTLLTPASGEVIGYILYVE